MKVHSTQAQFGEPMTLLVIIRNNQWFIYCRPGERDYLLKCVGDPKGEKKISLQQGWWLPHCYMKSIYSTSPEIRVHRRPSDKAEMKIMLQQAKEMSNITNQATEGRAAFSPDNLENTDPWTPGT